MTAVSPLVFPGSRTLAGWWKQLAPLQPRALWAGHLLLHRVEALAALHLLSPLDPIFLFVLRAVALSGGGSLQDLDQHLHLGLPLLRQLLRHLENEKLVRPVEGGTWSLTVLGRQGLEQGSYTQIRHERRAFYFVENEQPAGPPHFLKFSRSPAALAWPAGDNWKFEPDHLRACVGQPAEWKQRFGFPLEVEHILSGGTVPESAAVASPEWQHIIVDRPERLVVALVLTPASDRRERLLGFTVQPEGWVLQAAEPAFAIETGWQEVFPHLAMDLPLDQWHHAWRAWCQPRSLPAAEVAACTLERHSYRLRVTAMPRLIERLRAARSDVFKGEAWLLAGTGQLRAAAQVELVEMKRDKVAQVPSGKA
jgi:hypothetical protein